MTHSDGPRPFYAAGQFSVAQTTAPVKNPWDDTPAGHVSIADSATLQRAITAASQIAPDQFRCPRHQKSATCQRIADGIAARRDQFAALITAESGKPIQYARGEVDRAIITFTLAAHEALRFTGESLPLDISPAGERLTGHSERVPLGPVAAIAPFNFPLNLVAHKIAPALAVGTPVILKPAPQTPLTALLLADVIHESGALPGSVSVLPMENNTAEQMVRDDRLGVLSFTGSAKVGWHLKSISGRKRVLLELGGNAPAIVHEDADIAWALNRLVPAGFAAAGQVCIKAQRLLVHRKIYDNFISQYVAAAKALPTGDPTDPATVVGPLIDSKSADRIMEWIAEAISGGAKVLCGNNRTGNVIAPTILENVPPTARCATEEIFGPVVIAESYETIDQAIARANDTVYGLQAAIFSFDIRVIEAAASALEYGGIIVNDSPMVRMDNFPYGGAKASGLGREGVRYAMEEYTQPKVIIRRQLPPG